MARDISNENGKSSKRHSHSRQWRCLVPFFYRRKSVLDDSGGKGICPQEVSRIVSTDSKKNMEKGDSSGLERGSLHRREVAHTVLAKIRRWRYDRTAKSRHVRRLSRAARAGDVEAMYKLGRAFWWGLDGVDKDVRKTVKWYEHAISKGGHIRAMFDLAYILHEGEDMVKKDVPRAAVLYERAVVEGGDVDAMVNLGNILRIGEGGVEQDEKRAVDLYERAINLSDDEYAMNGLAIILETGDGDLRDVRRAVELYERAIGKGYCRAMSNLAETLEDGKGDIEVDVPRAIALYERAIREGEDVYAMRKLASILTDGKGETEKDVKRGTELFERAMEEYESSIAEEGDVESMFGLAWILQFGGDHMRDLRRSAQLYERAIEEGGHVVAMVNLALILEEGAEGVDKDLKRAVKLCERAVAKGNALAMNNLGILLAWRVDEMDGEDAVERDLKRALYLIEAAAAKGDETAISNLGIILTWGWGMDGMEGEDTINRDVERGLSLLETAAAKGNVNAMNTLGWTLTRGQFGVERDVCRAMNLFERAIKNGDIRAMIPLAFVLWRGIGGVRRDSRRAVQLLEFVLKKEKYPHAMRVFAEVLRQGDDHVRRDVPRAKDLLEDALVDSEGSPQHCLNSLALARLLLSEEAASLRDPGRAKSLLESSIGADFAPIHYELGMLLSRGDEGVKQDPERAERLFAIARSCGNYEVKDCEFVCDPCMRYFLDAGEESPVIVEEAIKSVTCKPLLCLMLVMGGAGRGKTSVVRSLKRACFVEEHNPTEFASLSRMGMLRGRGVASDAEFEDIEFACESLLANLSRAKAVAQAQAEQRGSHRLSRRSVDEKRRGRCVGKNTNGVRVQTRDRSQGAWGPVALDQDSISHTPVCKEVFAPKEEPAASRMPARGELEISEKPSEARREDGDSQLVQSWERKTRVLERGRLALTEQSAVPSSDHGALLHCWDLGGQTQYLMAHALFIGHASILVFVVDLERFQAEGTREEEVKELCRWMQMAHALCHDPGSARVVVVGTRMASCVDVEETKKALKEKLLEELGTAVYDDWVRQRIKEDEAKARTCFIAIENSLSVGDPVGSGLVELDGVLWSMAEEVVAEREGVPGRWLGFTEELEKSTRLMFLKKDIDDFVTDFPGFDSEKGVREEDALRALRYYRKLGRIVLFEENEGQYFVFVDPGKIVDFIRKVTGPEELIVSRLGKENALELRRGILTRKGLSVLWGEYDNEAQEVMLELLCKFDLLMRIKCSDGNGCEEDVIGVPALLPEGWEVFEWKLNRGQSELTVRTRFEDVLPIGLSGCLISHLHRTIGDEKTRLACLRANAAILALRGPCRVAVVFYSERREVRWVIRAEEPVKIAHRCLRALDRFLDGPLRKSRHDRRNYFIADCDESKGGCGGTSSVIIEIPLSWTTDHEWGNVGSDWEGECLNGEPWLLCDLVPLPVCAVDTPERPLMLCESRTKYDIFISHSGADKYTVAYPLREELAKLGWRSFLDEESLKPSARTNEEQIRAAIRGSRIGMFVLSPSFVMRKWPLLELKLFYERKDTAGASGELEPVLFPMFYQLTVEECGDGNLPRRREYRALFEESGFFSDAHQRHFSTPQAMDLLKRLTSCVGVRNDAGETDREFVARTAAVLHATFAKISSS